MSLPNAQVLMGLSRIFEIFDKNTSRCPSSGGWSLEKNITQVGVSLWERWFVSLGYSESAISAILVAFPTILNHFLTTKTQNWMKLITSSIYYEVIPFHLLWPIYHCRVCSRSKIWGTSSGFRTWCCRPLRSWRSRQGHLGSVFKVYYLSFVWVSYGRHNLLQHITTNLTLNSVAVRFLGSKLLTKS